MAVVPDFIYVIGPWWETKLLKGEPLSVVQSPREFGRRAIFISYVALLYTAWFLYKPSYSSFMNALILSLLASLGYYARYGQEAGFPMHVILIWYILYRGHEYVDAQTILTIALAYFYQFAQDWVYLKPAPIEDDQFCEEYKGRRVSNYEDR